MGTPPRMRRHDMRAMGTTVSIYGPDAPGFEEVERIAAETFGAEEERYSRFRPTSELSRVNAEAGSWTPVSRPFAAILDFVLDRARESLGLFDPTVLGAMEAAGYDRDLDVVTAAPARVPRPSTPCGRWREIERRRGAVWLPPGIGLDLGGVAKGWTADLAAERALGAGLPWLLVSAGGDLRIVGDAPELEIPIEDPDEAGLAIGALRLRSGALATSSTRRRTWGPGLHHVIDPRTGTPSATGVAQATVWAPTCAEAEIASTVALLEGIAGAARRPCLLVAEDGTVYRSFAGARPDDDRVAA